MCAFKTNSEVDSMFASLQKQPDSVSRAIFLVSLFAAFEIAISSFVGAKSSIFIRLSIFCFLITQPVLFSNRKLIFDFLQVLKLA